MKASITSKRKNLLLGRTEVHFLVEHDQKGSTPSRLEIREIIAKNLKTDKDLVFVKKYETKTGTSVAAGSANIYEDSVKASLVEPTYIIERNRRHEKAEEERK